MIAEYEGCGYGEGDVQQFSLRIHAAKDVEHCDVVRKVRNHSGGGCLVDTKQMTEFLQSASERAGDPLNHRERSDQYDTDLTAGQKAGIQRRQSGRRVLRSHLVEQREHDTGDLLKYSDRRQSGDHDGHADSEAVESADHAAGMEPQADDDQGSDDDNRDQVLNDPSDAQLVARHSRHAQTAHDAADRNGDHSGQHAGAEVTSVLLIDDAEGNRDGKYDRRSHHGTENQSCEFSDRLVSRQLHRQRIAAHVAGKKCGGEHG